jgi:HK97 gp10 family phage protein
MPVRVKMELKGLEEYLEQLVQVEKDVDAVAANALKAGGDVLLKGMQRRVPKDTHNLEQNLKCTEPVRDGNYTFVEVGLSKDTDAETARYGTAQEYGTSSMEAQAYIRPTVDADAGKARKAMKEVLEKALGKM